MKNSIVKKAAMLGLVFCIFLSLISLFNSNEAVEYVNKKLIPKKGIEVNGAFYDGPEKFAYYHSALRAGQEDLNAPMEYPQYDRFYKKTELKKARSIRSSARVNTTNATFKERGPANVPGRTRTIIVDPDDPNQATWLVGSVSGGIWKTTNSGGTWVDVAPDIVDMGIVAMAISKSNSSVIFAGTGEGFLSAGAFTLNGSGIYKSIDKGFTWTLLSSTNTEDFTNVSRIIIDPNDENIIIASTGGHLAIGSSANTGGAIMRSVDGGLTWEKVFSSTTAMQQVIAAPSDFNIQYATILGIGVVKSINAGVTWNTVSTGLSLSGRIELAISYSDPNKVYGTAQGNLSGTGSDLYVTVDGGNNWTTIGVNYNNTAIHFLNGQGWYDNTVMVNPFDDNHIYFGGVSAFSMVIDPSTNAGTLSIVADGRNLFDGTNNQTQGKTNGVHPDHHFLMPIITNEAEKEFRILNCNDGGVYLSDAGTSPGTTQDSWTFAGTDYNTTQFYGADKITGEEEYIGGAQDNGTWLSSDGEITDSKSNYKHIIGGDGFEVVTHMNDPDKFIGGSQFNGFLGSEDRGLTFYPATNGLTGNGPFVSRLSNSYQDPDVLFAVENSGVFKSVDFGKNWKPSVMNGTGWNFWTGTDVEVSKADPRIVWAGGRMTTNSNLFVSTNGGISFDPVPDFANIGLCTGLYSHPTDPNSAFAVFSVAQSPKVLRTKDLGQTWEDISGFSANSTSTGYPDVATFAVVAMPFDEKIIWAGTEIGLFESIDGGQNWLLIDEFPSVAIWDFKIKDGQIIIATHGRGIWTADIQELGNFQLPEVTLSPRVNKVGASFIALEINLTLTLRAIYDETKIYLNGQEYSSLGANSKVGVRDIVIDDIAAGTYELQLISDKDGIQYFSDKYNIILNESVAPVNGYGQNFENTEANEFTLDQFTIGQPAGFTDKLLSTVHPYPAGNISLTAKLNQPIIVASEDAFLKFKEVVQVEAGDPGSVFGDLEFWDYVLVEGTLDGVNWIPFLDGYDASANSKWNGGSASASESLLVERTIDLQNAFNAGDIILIRFRLFTDAAATAWGWGIDDILIQTEDKDGDGYSVLSDCDDNDAAINPSAEDIANNGIDEDCDGEDLIIATIGDESLIQKINIFPNPAVSIINIETPSKINSVTIFTVNGEKVYDSATPTKIIVISNLVPGMYLVKVNIDNKTFHNNFIKL